MSRIPGRLLYWSPRLLGVAFVIFISLFALDVFSMRLPLGRMLLALAMHMVLPAAIAVVLAMAWRWPWVGGPGFTALGLWFLWIARGRFVLQAYLILAGPAFLIALLFFVNGIWRRELRVALRNSLKENV